MTKRDSFELIYNASVLRSARENHIWLNAFSCIHPTDEWKIQLADAILAKLDNPDETILCNHGGGPLEDLGMRELIVRFNKS